MSKQITRLFETIDRMDPEGFVDFLTEDASFRFGNADPVIGRNNIREAVAGFFSMIKGLSHQIFNVWEIENAIICRGEVTYKRMDEKDVKVPFVNFFMMENTLIKEYQIYIDLTPLFAA